MGSHRGAPVDPRRDWGGDADPVDSKAASFLGKGLALSVRPSEGEGSLASPLDKGRSAMDRVVLIGFVEGYVLFGLAGFIGGVFLTAFIVWRVAPKWLANVTF